MNIIIITDVVHAGGAETFVLRLAQALKKEGHTPFLFILRHDVINHKLKNLLAPDVPLITARIPFFLVWNKLDSLLFRLKIDYSFIRSFYVRQLMHSLKKCKADIVHSHLFTSDMVAIAAAIKLSIPVVTTLHGDYLLYDKNPSALRISKILNYPVKLKQVFRSISAFVSITDEQKRQVCQLQSRYGVAKPVYKIYNGYKQISKDKLISRKELQIHEDSFIIGMVARGIKEKGWYELIESFLRVKIPNSHLILVGGGSFLEEMKSKYIVPNIHFIGEVSNPQPYIDLFDIGCLPSYFEAESLPTVIIEYIFAGKPVLATNKAEILNMLSIGNSDACGVVIEIGRPEEMIRSLGAALSRLHSHKDVYGTFKQNTIKAAAKFDMMRCVEEYEKVYKTIV